MHLEDASERRIIAKHLEKNPWLIHPTWILNKKEARVLTWIQEQFPTTKFEDTGHDDDRVDFFCVAVGGVLHIVEIKRGGHIAKEKDFLQADKYRQYVLKRFEEISDPEAIKYNIVQSQLIASELHHDATGIKIAYQNQGWVTFTPWHDLIERAKRSHKQFRDELKKQARNPICKLVH